MRELLSQNRFVIANHLSKSKELRVIVKPHKSYGLLLNKGAHIYTSKNNFTHVAIT